MRAEVARVKARLEDLGAFESEWRAYADTLRQLAAQMTGREPLDIPAEVRPMLIAAERARVAIVSLGHTKFDGTYFTRTEFSPLTRSNLRTNPGDLFNAFTEPTSFPRSRAVVTLNALEALLGEAESLIARKREQMNDDLRAKAFRVKEHERGTVTLRALAEKWLAHVPGAGFRHLLSSVVLENTKKALVFFLSVAAVAGVHYCAPGVEQKAKDWWQRTTADSTGTHP